MKVTTDACLFGAWVASDMTNDLSKSARLLDIGTGTGLLSLMIAQKNEVYIDAVEIEEQAAKQAVENVKASPWSGRIQIVNKNIKDFNADKKYNYIISNPPFYENELAGTTIQKNMAHHDAALVLNDLLEYIRGNLEEGGSFYLLLPAKRIEEIEKLIADLKLFISAKIIVKPSTTHARFRMIIKGGLHQKETFTSEISITDGSKNYTSEFIALLKDYYLYL